MANVIYLHIPHTGGRTLGRCFWVESIPVRRVHNAQEISQLDPGGILYWVLREPLTRCLGEYVHYTVVYGKEGRVNHLDRDVLQQDLTDPRTYFSLEVNRNVMCKFLLLRHDFSVPVTEEEYQHLLEKKSSWVFDVFGDPTNYVNLSRLVNQPVEKLNQSRHYFTSVVRDKTPYWQDVSLMEFLREVHAYDLRLYQELQ